MSFTELHAFVVTVAVPGAIAALFLLAAWRPWRSKNAILNGFWGGAAGFATAYAVGHMLNMGRLPGLPPTQVQDWLPYLAACAAAVGFLATLRLVPGWAHVVTMGLLGAAGAGVIIGALAEASRPGMGQIGLIVAATGVFVAAGVWSFDQLAERVRGAAPPATLWVTLAGASYLLVAYKAAFAMHLAGVLAAGCAVAAILALWRPTIAIARGGVHVVLVTFAGVLLIASLFSEMPLWVASLAFVTPHAAWAGDLPWIRSRRPWVRALVRIVAVAMAIGLIVAIGRPAPNPYGDLYEGY